MTTLLRALGAPPPRLWRSPWGRLLKTTTRCIAEQRRLELAGRTIDGRDWAGGSGAKLYAGVGA